MNFKEIAIDLAHQAGAIMMDNFKLGMNKDWKSDGTPLTISDTAINSMVIEVLSQKYPEHGILGEEGSFNLNDDNEYVWVLDPIDGTIPFSHAMPLFAFSLALTKNGDPILGVIFDPSLDRMLVAEKGKGATLNGKPVHVSDNSSVNQTLIEVQSWRGYDKNLNSLKNELIEQGAQVTTICSVVYAGLMVAIGEYGGILFSGKKPWDAAAVKIVVEEAGGRVTDLQGNEQHYDKTMNGVVVSNGALHETLLDFVASV